MSKRSVDDPHADTLPSGGRVGGDAGALPKPSSTSGTRRRGVEVCLSDEEIVAVAAGTATPTLQSHADAHIDRCASCQELLSLAVSAPPSAANDVSLSPLSERPVSFPPMSRPALATTFAPGDLVAERYKIVRLVRDGGMGEVYEAFDRLGENRVALKTVLCTASDDANAVKNLRREVRIAQRVSHPNVCRINELHEHLDPRRNRLPVHFYTMEFIEGETLGSRLRRGPLPLAEARAIARQLLDGLEAAHTKGVLHLDFKSDNVMLRQNKSGVEAVILDFGLSRVLDPEARPRTSEQQHCAGTLGYMAAEQFRGDKNLKAPTDIYAFGVVLYEMLAGALPYTADNGTQMYLKQRDERPPAPSSFRPQLSPALDHFVLKCLRFNPQSRYATAASASQAFDALGDWSSKPGLWHRGRRLLLAALATAVVAVWIGYLPLSSSRNVPAPPAREVPRTEVLQQWPKQPIETPAPVATLPPVVGDSLPEPAATEAVLPQVPPVVKGNKSVRPPTDTQRDDASKQPLPGDLREETSPPPDPTEALPQLDRKPALPGAPGGLVRFNRGARLQAPVGSVAGAARTANDK
jgi:serine/threonine protein kinase